jgi:RND family efflux transporter MFP subunit
MSDKRFEIRDNMKIVRRVLPFVVLAVGILGARALIKSRKPPKRKEKPPIGILVETKTVRPESRRVLVRSHGSVQPQRELSIAAEVAGRVLWVNPQLIVGGIIKKGAPLVRIDGVDYRLALAKARTQVAQAQRAVAEAASNSTVLKREWKILGKRTGRKKPNPLTLGIPQLKQAQAQLDAAKADVRQAAVRLGRTTIRAPFNLRVRRESIEEGKYVAPGAPFCTVVGTDAAEVIVPLRLSDLQWISIPRQVFDSNGRVRVVGEGSKVWVKLKAGVKTYRREGKIERTVGEIDATGRLTRVVVSIPDPYNVKLPAVTTESKDGASQSAAMPFKPDFAVGSFVDVEIVGRKLESVVPIPAEALRLGSVVWLANQGKLEIRKVELLRREKNEVLIASGLQQGDRVITTPLASALNGQAIRVAGQSKKTAPPQKANTPAVGGKTPPDNGSVPAKKSAVKDGKGQKSAKPKASGGAKTGALVEPRARQRAQG